MRFILMCLLLFFACGEQSDPLQNNAEPNIDGKEEQVLAYGKYLAPSQSRSLAHEIVDSIEDSSLVEVYRHLAEGAMFFGGVNAVYGSSFDLAFIEVDSGCYMCGGYTDSGRVYLLLYGTARNIPRDTLFKDNFGYYNINVGSSVTFLMFLRDTMSEKLRFIKKNAAG